MDTSQILGVFCNFVGLGKMVDPGFHSTQAVHQLDNASLDAAGYVCIVIHLRVEDGCLHGDQAHSSMSR